MDSDLLIEQDALLTLIETPWLALIPRLTS